MLEAGIESLLSATPGIVALVGMRIYPVALPPELETFPALTYQVVSGGSEWALDRTKYNEKRIQFDAWGARYSDCKSILKQLTKLLDGYTGILPGPESSPMSDQVRVISVFSGVTIDNFESNGRGFRCLTEFFFQFVEA